MYLLGQFLTNAQVTNTETLESLVNTEWQIFSESEIVKKDSLLLFKSKLYKSIKDYENALKTLDRVTYSSNPSIESALFYERITINYLQGNHKEVKNLILESTFVEGFTKNDQINLIEALNYVALEELNEGKEVFASLIDDQEIAEEIFEGRKFKNPKLAFTLSFILPGSGQAYAGKFHHGILSLGVQSSLFYLGVNGLSRGYIFTESIPSIALFQGFYFGGAEYAKRLAIEKNEETIQVISREIFIEAKKRSQL